MKVSVRGPGKRVVARKESSVKCIKPGFCEKDFVVL